MTQRKRKGGVHKGQCGDARKKTTQLQRIKQVRVHSGSVGPLLVGVGTEPTDLDVHFEHITGEAHSNQAWRAFGFRVRLSKLMLVVLFVGIILVYAMFQHDRELIRDGFDVFKSLSPSGMNSHAQKSHPKGRDLEDR